MSQCDFQRCAQTIAGRLEDVFPDPEDIFSACPDEGACQRARHVYQQWKEWHEGIEEDDDETRKAIRDALAAAFRFLATSEGQQHVNEVLGREAQQGQEEQKGLLEEWREWLGKEENNSFVLPSEVQQAGLEALAAAFRFLETEQGQQHVNVILGGQEEHKGLLEEWREWLKEGQRNKDKEVRQAGLKALAAAFSFLETEQGQQHVNEVLGREGQKGLLEEWKRKWQSQSQDPDLIFASLCLLEGTFIIAKRWKKEEGAEAEEGIGRMIQKLGELTKSPTNEDRSQSGEGQ